ncbi:hypothetical protein [Streptomyces sp. NBC_00268]|uniref:hypothetical protein n=1 Tax=Streptomyces sp. NBC_00268 TaxID=2975695 RepID=UPI002258529A|nr:hypothetical protein [Streptomyces sp. NBC_00268]MCX5182603.1 hypothetical protein [Streptomyces sp. NBC_00268]
MLRRTMLPPNLTRHLYETRRLIAESEGRDLQPWFRLTADERAAVERDMEVFRRAILRAEEEQDLIAAYNASAAEQPQSTADSTAPLVGNCGCPGYSTVAALIELVSQAKRLEATLGWDVDSRGKGSSVFAFTSPEPSAEEVARVRRAAREAVDRWTAAGKPLEGTTPTAVWSFEVEPPKSTLSRYYLQRLHELILRTPYQPGFPLLITDFWTTRPPTVDKA